MASKFSQTFLQESFTRYKLGTSLKKTFETCQFNENTRLICWLESEHNCSGKNARWCFKKTQGNKYL